MRLKIPLLLLVCLISRHASGMEIELRFADGFEQYPGARQRVEYAAALWEDALADPVTVRIGIELATPFERVQSHFAFPLLGGFASMGVTAIGVSGMFSSTSSLEAAGVTASRFAHSQGGDDRGRYQSGRTRRTGH